MQLRRRTLAQPLGADARPHDLAQSSAMEEEVIPVLRVEDAGRAIAWYEQLGFQKQWEHQFEPGFPLFVSIARGRVRIYLSEHTGDATPNTLIHLNVNDIDSIATALEVPVDENGLAGRECDVEDRTATASGSGLRPVRPSASRLKRVVGLHASSASTGTRSRRPRSP